ncbi:hypothetical protein FH972_023703 [Carpinus fangiana]|uniref:Ribosomal protein S21 n=1 Tax=Carpinus fangiana TaxID=176857 RepID=A0A5N6KW80_9ROSI|nr:hypothetical protein FH972_023703 [Carpinus fangiana]
MMEVRRAAERRLLLLMHRPAIRTNINSQARFRAPSTRALSVSRSIRTDPSDDHSRSAPRSNAPTPSGGSPAAKNSHTSALDALLASRLDFARGPPSKSPRSPPLNRNPNTQSPSARHAADSPSKPDSVKELLRRINEKSLTPEMQALDREPPRNTLGAKPRGGIYLGDDLPRTSDSYRGPQAIAAAMLRAMPGGEFSNMSVSATAAPPFRINASLGRSIKVEPERGMDLGRAFRTLDGSLSRNRVRADVFRQRFHERPGLKRKRLRSERWRRRFKEGFQDVVKRVQELKRKGW